MKWRWIVFLSLGCAQRAYKGLRGLPAGNPGEHDLAIRPEINIVRDSERFRNEGVQSSANYSS